LQKWLEELDDKMMKERSEAFTESLAFYSASKTDIASGQIGLKSVFEDLSARFPGRQTTNADPVKSNKTLN